MSPSNGPTILRSNTNQLLWWEKFEAPRGHQHEADANQRQRVSKEKEGDEARGRREWEKYGNGI